MILLSACKVELEVQCDDDKRSHLVSTKSLYVLQPHLLVLSVEALPTLLSSSPPTASFRLGVVSRKSSSLPDNFAVPSATGNMNTSPFV